MTSWSSPTLGPTPTSQAERLIFDVHKLHCPPELGDTQCLVPACARSLAGVMLPIRAHMLEGAGRMHWVCGAMACARVGVLSVAPSSGTSGDRPPAICVVVVCGKVEAGRVFCVTSLRLKHPSAPLGAPGVAHACFRYVLADTRAACTRATSHASAIVVGSLFLRSLVLRLWSEASAQLGAQALVGIAWAIRRRPSPGERMEIPGQGRVLHFQDPLAQQHVLHHNVSGELVCLPFPASAQVSLHTGDEGFAYLTAEGSPDAVWFASLWRRRLVSVGDGEPLHLFAPPGSISQLSDVLATFGPMEVRVPIYLPQSAGVEVYRFAQSGTACLYWWSLPAMHVAVVGDQGGMAAARRLQSWMLLWRKMLETLGLGGVHLRLAARTKHSKSRPPACAPRHQHLLRLFWRCGVGGRSTSGEGVQKRSDTQGAWRAALGYFIQRIIGDCSFMVPVYLDTTLTLDGNHVVPFSSDHQVLVSMESNEVNFSQVLSTRGRVADKVRRQAALTEVMGVVVFLLAAESMGAVFMWLWLQALHWVPHAVGVVLEATRLPEGPHDKLRSIDGVGDKPLATSTSSSPTCPAASSSTDGGARSLARHASFAKPMLGKIALALRDTQVFKIPAALCQYFWCMRRLWERVSVIGIVVDGARAGGRSCFFGIASQSTNQVAWLPLQAIWRPSLSLQVVLGVFRGGAHV